MLPVSIPDHRDVTMLSTTDINVNFLHVCLTHARSLTLTEPRRLMSGIMPAAGNVVTKVTETLGL